MQLHLAEGHEEEKCVPRLQNLSEKVGFCRTYRDDSTVEVSSVYLHPRRLYLFICIYLFIYVFISHALEKEEEEEEQVLWERRRRLYCICIVLCCGLSPGPRLEYGSDGGALYQHSLGESEGIKVQPGLGSHHTPSGLCQTC